MQNEILLAGVLAVIILTITLLRNVLEVRRGMDNLDVLFVNAVLPTDYNFEEYTRYIRSEIPNIYRNHVYLPPNGFSHAQLGQIIYSLSDRAIYVNGMFGIKLLQKVDVSPQVIADGPEIHSIFLLGMWRKTHPDCNAYLRKTLLNVNHS